MHITSRLDRIFEPISENTVIKAIRQGLLYIMPLIMVGSFALMLLNLPIEAVNRFFTGLMGDHWRSFCLAVHKGTFRIMSLSTLLSVSYAYAKEHPLVKTGKLNPIFIILTSLSCYITYDPGLDTVIHEDATDTTAMFAAIVIALLSVQIFILFYKYLPRRRRIYAYDADTILLSSIYNVFPVLSTILVFSLARLVFDLTGLVDFTQRVSSSLNTAVLQGSSGLLTALLYTLITHVMWFFGIHGTNMMERLAQDVFVASSNANIALAVSGEVPTQILTKEFFDVFVYLGGAGCTLGLLIALFFAGRSSNVNRLAKYSLLPGLFNINELIIYGLPIIFNPYYLVPFLLTPAVLCVTSYLAFASGLVPLTASRVMWTTPIFLSGYSSTGSVAGVLLQAFNLILAAAIHLPFVHMYEKKITRSNMAIFRQLSDEYNNASAEEPPEMLARNDEFGMMARSIASELRTAMADPAFGLHMEFQPKSNGDGRVYGAEALLRWTHPAYGNVSPLVALGIGEEAGLTVELGTWILEQSFAQLRVWQEHEYALVLSVNLSPKQLKEDDLLADRLTRIIRQGALNPANMELELTEHAALDQSESTRGRLEQIKNMGVNIAIDDFGMGNSSLLYLRDFYANVVKLDVSLIRTINESIHSQEIVRSIVLLCEQLGAGIVAEGVETIDQLRALQALGCDQFQGWYFSKSLQPDSFLEYVREHGVVQGEPDSAVTNITAAVQEKK